MHGRYIDKANFYSGIYTLLILSMYVLLTQKDNDLKMLCVKSALAVAFAIVIAFWKSKKVTGGLLYCLCLAFMHMGQVLIIAFGKEFTQQLKSSIAIGNGIANSIPAVHFSTLACLVTFTMMCFIETNNIVIIDNSALMTVEEKDQMRIHPIALVFIGIIGVLTILSDVLRVISVAAVGYGAGYKQTNTILYYADMVFTICLFLLISTYKNNKKVIKYIMLFVLLRSAASAFFIGARSDAVLNIVMCGFAVTKLTTDVRIKKGVIRSFMWICVIGVVALPFTGISRNNASLTLASFFQEYNPISYSLTEFGGTIVNVCKGIAQTGELPITEFFKSFLSIIPMSTTLIPSLQSNYGGSYAAYLNINFNGGLGGSLIGEAAFWFGTGFTGLIYIMAIAGIVAICMNILERNRFNNKIASNTAILFLLYEMFYHIRGSVSDFQSGIKLAIYFFVILKFTWKYVFIVDKKEQY